jgi:hypothetical protein
MKRSSWAAVSTGLIVALSIVAHAADKVQPLNVKVGLWEVITTATTSGGNPIPPETLQGLSPEQRTRIEERMKAMPGSRTVTHKTCMTKEKLDDGSSFIEDRRSCTFTVVTSSSSQLELKGTCDNGGMKSSGSVRAKVVNTENIKGFSRMTMTGGDQTINVKSTYTGKWIGPACGSVR